jgi:hypothetical protein
MGHFANSAPERAVVQKEEMMATTAKVCSDIGVGPGDIAMVISKGRSPWTNRRETLLMRKMGITGRNRSRNAYLEVL